MDIGTSTGTVCAGDDPRLTDSRPPGSHTHGGGDIISSVSNATTAANLTRQVIAGIGLSGGGVLNSNRTLDMIYGTSSNTACEGNDSRLSNARTPTSHTHGDISNTGTIGSTANLPLITTTNGKIVTGSFGTAANTFCQGNDSRLSNARTPTNHGLVSGSHTASGLTTGHYLRATGSTSFAFSGILAGDIPTLNQNTTGQAGSVANSINAGNGLSGSSYNGSSARTWSVIYGTAANTACVGNDSRLSNARTPTSHGNSVHSDINQSLLTTSTVRFGAIGVNRAGSTTYRVYCDGYISGTRYYIGTARKDNVWDAKQNALNADQIRKTTISSSAPSGGSNGDVWLRT